MQTKLSQLRAMMDDGDWRGALGMAARFPRLGAHKEPVTRAWAAIQNPSMYRQMRKDPDALVAAGVEALRARYPD